MATTNVGGYPINHGEVIHTNSTTTFGLMDRIRILLGRKMTLYTVIYCAEDGVTVVASEAKPMVAPFFKPKSYGLVMVAPEYDDSKEPYDID